MNTRCWLRWASVWAAASCLAGCGAGAATSDAGVLTKGMAGTQGPVASGGIGAGGVGGLGVGGGSNAGGTMGPVMDGGVGGSAVGGAEGNVDAHVDLIEPTKDAATDAQRDLISDAPVLADAPMAETPAPDAPREDALPTDTSPAETGPDPCPVMTTEWAAPHAARSGGYSGTLSDYGDLYDVTCMSLQRCTETCITAGGTADSCMAGSECVDGGQGAGRHCLPPTYWRYEDRALEPSDDLTEAAQQTLVLIDYNDPLVVRDFRVTVPAGATVRGIQFSVRHSADEDTAVDDSIRILRDGQPVGTDHKKADAWPMDLAYTAYGGPNDTWGATWTSDDVQAAGFGLAVAARYTLTSGNARAYVDYVRVRVSFVPASCPGNAP